MNSPFTLAAIYNHPTKLYGNGTSKSCIAPSLLPFDVYGLKLTRPELAVAGRRIWVTARGTRPQLRMHGRIRIRRYITCVPASTSA
jgi:hypothetical protein